MFARCQARAGPGRGLAQAGGGYKRALKALGLPEGEHLEFMDFLRRHRLKPHIPITRIMSKGLNSQ